MTYACGRTWGELSVKNKIKKKNDAEQPAACCNDEKWRAVSPSSRSMLLGRSSAENFEFFAISWNLPLRIWSLLKISTSSIWLKLGRQAPHGLEDETSNFFPIRPTGSEVRILALLKDQKNVGNFKLNLGGSKLQERRGRES